jgi:nicotinate-nucleotide adenylyltransferase
MNIGILGSYFNPPHLGHILTVQQCLDFAEFDRIWLLPGLKSTFNKKLINVKHRLSMVKLINLPQTKVSTLEIDNQLDGNTINLIPILKDKYPQHQFTFIIGSDQLATFNQWGSWQELLKKLPFLVAPRAGFALKPLYGGMRVLKHPLLITSNVSSTLIRERLKQGFPIDNLVTREVKEYILKNKLYI